MKKIIVFLIFAFAAWYGWKHWSEFSNRQPSHEAVVVNATGVTLLRIRLTVDGQTFVKEELPPEDKIVFPFRVKNDASFRLVWEWKDRVAESHWDGGMVPKGPMVQRHTMQVDGEGGVTYTAENK